MFRLCFSSFLYVRGQKTGCLSVAHPKIRKTTITAWHGSNKKLSIPIKIKLRWGRIYCRALVIDCINELIARCTLICFNFYRRRSTSPHISCLLCLVDWRHSWGAGAAFLLDDVMRVCESLTPPSLGVVLKRWSHPYTRVRRISFDSSGCTASCSLLDPLNPPRARAHPNTYSSVKQQHNTGSYLGFVCNLFGRFVRQAQWY